MVMPFKTNMVSGVEVEKEKLLAEHRCREQSNDPREDLKRINQLSRKCKPCKYGKVEEHGCMLQVMELEREVKKREV